MKKAYAGFGLLVIIGVCALLLVRPAAMGLPAQAQTASAPSLASTSGSGRYQMLSPNANGVVVIDTATGRVWGRNLSGGVWTDFGSPVTSK